MKNIIKNSILALTLALFASCENDTDPVAVPGSGFKLLAPDSSTTYILSPEDAEDPMATFVWEQSDNGVQSASDYTLQIALAGTNFDAPIDVAPTQNRYLALVTEIINAKLIAQPADGGLGINPYTETEVDFRIKSALGNSSNAVVQYSNVITLKITPYTADLPKIAVPGNHQGWDPATAPLLASSAYGATDYEGYVWLNGEFKFVAPNASGQFAWGNTDYGDDGTFSDVLVATNEVNCQASAGYYLVKANTVAGTYSTQAANWAITGSATPNGWPDPAPDHDMTYNSTTKKWEITIALSAGEFKFRANNGWTLNLGADNDGDGSMDYGGPNLTVSSAGTYTVILDLSNPRKYTYSIQ